MPFRGEEYDLDRTYWVDERSDPEKATRAAARHMRDLYDMFGDWYLVMAAYNSGPMNVVKGVERTGYADFWELQQLHALPKQTQNYVPIIIALALVGKDPALYGVEVAPEKPRRDGRDLSQAFDRFASGGRRDRRGHRRSAGAESGIAAQRDAQRCELRTEAARGLRREISGRYQPGAAGQMDQLAAA